MLRAWNPILRITGNRLWVWRSLLRCEESAMKLSKLPYLYWRLKPENGL